ncbi:MAG TPA: LysR family transcriptional regulator [Paracoccus sp. (in: a-proteobacteria)]|uniref:LysR family transcriptional regulator n=1 Tax=uncultured Paracoccus sp. TaxID=189685 RepID=UPI00261D4273|nr:LysR family transcriptional regulator [uncultured Paracoccus sp.]HMQ40411.1 LysR family transcriptional regulator [Paracoccus sp. (in: a-proteobacteria)]HMR35603.1 LysR family transcriptional regulator [Paracoccus sp. (in: a-proteobacteria)]
MRFRGLDLNLLVALDVMLRERHVTRASEQLNLSQAATSNALSRLREYFDDDLLVRVGRRMVLTDRARALQAELEEVLRRIETTVMSAPDVPPQQLKRRVTVAAADAITTDLLARLTSRLASEAPGLQLFIRPLASNPDQVLERGGVDLLVIPRQFASANHPMQILYAEGFRVLACREGKWGSRSVTAEDYLGASHVIVEIGPEQKIPVDRAIIEQGHGRLNAAVSVASQVTVPWHLVGTDRLGTVPETVAERFGTLLPLRSHPLPFDVPQNRIVMQWNAQRDHDGGLAWLRGLMVELCADRAAT